MKARYQMEQRWSVIIGEIAIKDLNISYNKGKSYVLKDLLCPNHVWIEVLRANRLSPEQACSGPILHFIYFHLFDRLKQDSFESPFGGLAGFSPFILSHPITVAMQQMSGKGIFIVNGSLIAVFAESAVSVVKVLRVYTILLRNKFALRFYKFTQAGIRIICFCWQIANTGFEQLIF